MQKRIESFKYALNGFKLVLKSEFNMRIHLFFAITIAILGLILGISYIEWGFIILCIILVLAAEIANTIVEKYLDTYHPGFSENIGAIKDMSAAAVLILAIGAGLIGCIILLPKLTSLIHT